MSKLSNVARHPLDNLARALNSFGHRHRIDRVFFDWVEMCALALSNKVDFAQYDRREADYMTIVKAYSKEEARLMAEMMAMLVQALERSYESPFQALLQKLELGSTGAKKRLGQFMTPFTLSQAMARMSLAPADGLAELVAQKGYITMMEPACGAGGMILAFAEALQEAGINFQKQLHVTAQDVDRSCTHMSYVCASLVGIPAVVLQGNSLSNDPPSQVWYTPFHVMHGWTGRLKYQDVPQLPERVIEPDPMLEDVQELMALLEQVTPDPTPQLPDPLIQRPGLTRWKIIPDDAGPTLSLP